MPFFDVVDDVARHQFEKNAMGDNRIMGALVCNVTKNYDKEKQGFVQVNITTRDYDENKLVWARMALPYGGQKWGEYFIPEVGDQVIVVFEQGNIERAFVIGALPKTNSTFVSKAFHEQNDIKKIMTRNGNTIEIIDNHEGEGDKDKITITTSGEGHKFQLDNEKKVILLSDKEGKNQIEMKTESGQMTINAEKKLTVKVGENITLYMNGSNGTVTLEATKFKMETSNSTEVKSNNRVSIEGGNVSVSGNSMLKLSSSGPVSVEGTPVKLG
ncbi:MAG: hypothetical protein II842_17985 [Butyrivibrio sp.]|nr:hypothetical protein [Butyrivibrio sp.]